MGRPFSEPGLLAILFVLLLPNGSLTLENHRQLNQDQVPSEPQTRFESPTGDIDFNGVDFAHKMKNSSEQNKTDDAETRVLRLAVFSDDALLNHLSDMHPEDPLSASHSYVTAGVSAIEQVIQQAMGKGVEFKIKLVQVGVWAEKGATPFNTNGLSSSNLLNFCEWASERKPGRGDPGYWHHAMMLTGNETCLERGAASSRATPKELDHTKGGPPGQRYPADAQCQLAHGKGFKATPSKRNLCQYLMCTNGVTTRGAHPALPGTTCGANRICVAGDCKEGKIPPTKPPTKPPTEPPTKPPTKPPGNGSGGSVFPPAKIPNEIQYIPIPQRCYFLPPFLHPYIDCKSPPTGPSNPNRPQRPNRPENPNRPQSPAKEPQPFRIGISALPGVKNNRSFSEDNYTRILVNDEPVETTAEVKTTKTIASKSESTEATTTSAEFAEATTFEPESPKTTVSSDESWQVFNDEAPIPEGNSQETTTVTIKSLENTTAESSQIPTTEAKLPDDEFVLFDAVNEAVGSLAGEIRSLTEEGDQLQDDKENGEKVFDVKDLDGADQNATDTETKSDILDANRTTETHEPTEEVTAMPYTTETITTQTTTDSFVREEMTTSPLPYEAKNTTQGHTNLSRSEQPVTLRLTADDAHQLEDISRSQVGNQTTTTETPTSPVDEKQPSKNNEGEEETSATFSVDNFTIAGSGLHFSLPSHLLQNLLAPLLMNSHGTGAPMMKAAEDPRVSRRQSEENFHRHDSAHPRISYLRDGYRQEPLLAATAPVHTRAFRISPCTRACGAGTRRVAQVCVETSAPDVVVSQDFCNGLPNIVAPFNQSCNTFPCAVPEWVVGPWSPCSHWCGLGLQRRLVACGMSLVEGAAPLGAGRFLAAGKCSGDQPLDVKLCKGSCIQVDCKLPSNRLHPACYHLLGETPIERDHRPSS